LKFLLDTHILLYWLGDIEKLSGRQTHIIQAADAGEPLWVSDISLWEIATLHSLGRIQLRHPLRDWLEAAVAPPLVRRIGISPAVAACVGALPDSFHRDPGDRIIVASTQILGATLLTHDRRIIAANLVSTLT
jgi:PIN domain nuclease of toxin-antitoxin system